MLDNYRNTSHDLLGGSLRLLLGFVFFSAGILKLVVPSLGEAFSGQLVAANIPLRELVLNTFPLIEMSLGVLLLIGYHTRVSALVASVTMIVAAYVHVMVEDPSLFPLQPVEPVGPLVLLMMLLYIVFRGGGAWSVDLKASARSPRNFS